MSASHVCHRILGQSRTHLLPFLYCTPTILKTGGAYTWSSSSRFLVCRSKRVASDLAGRRSSSAIPFEEDESFKEPTPFDDDEHASNKDEPTSTLTYKERAIFERIHQKQRRHEKREAAAGEGSGALEERNTWSYGNDAIDDLNSIFEAAIETARARERWGPVDPDNFKILRFPSARKLQATDSNPFIPPGKDHRTLSTTDEGEENLRIACQSERERIDQMLINTKSDAEIWHILETEVYSMVEELKRQMAQEETRRRDRAITTNSAAGAQDEVKRRSGKKTAKISKQLASSSAELSEAASTTAAGPHTLEVESKALTSTHLLASLQANYAHHNLHALRLWRQRNPSSPYALQVLPKLRALGPVSYVLGATTSLYNEILFLKWSRYHDLHGVADLLDDMLNMGLVPDSLTLDFLLFLDRERTGQLRRGKGANPAMRLWWSFGQMRQDWARVGEAYRVMKSMVLQATLVSDGAGMDDFGSGVGVHATDEAGEMEKGEERPAWWLNEDELAKALHRRGQTKGAALGLSGIDLEARIDGGFEDDLDDGDEEDRGDVVMQKPR